MVKACVLVRLGPDARSHYQDRIHRNGVPVVSTAVGEGASRGGRAASWVSNALFGSPISRILARVSSFSASGVLANDHIWDAECTPSTAARRASATFVSAD